MLQAIGVMDFRAQFPRTGWHLATLGAAVGLLAIQQLLSALTADCDGVVAVLGVNLTAAELAQRTANPANWLDDVDCPGTNSPVGCGGNSDYTVYYIMVNSTSLAVVPNLWGKSEPDATSIAQQANLSLDTTVSRTGPHNMAFPYVNEQSPVAGTHVAPFSTINAVLLYPSGKPF